jgi:hypothetical protein
MAELGSHQVDVADWAYQSSPSPLLVSEGWILERWKRYVFDNVSVIFDYPQDKSLCLLRSATMPIWIFLKSSWGRRIHRNYSPNNNARATFFVKTSRRTPHNKSVALIRKSRIGGQGNCQEPERRRVSHFPQFPQKTLGLLTRSTTPKNG